ncbi:MAG: GlsB/YeaQ/YmgE family stress response membrane protein [Deltaproteobacteria bacterium]|nr:GlsB/YeaQ/YmgE family stress response membrane protein [Deltaproteobacteria bacterium]
MNWIVTIIVGAIVGWLASMAMNTNAQMGAVANILVGIVGSALGFWLAGALGLVAAGPIMGWLVAVAGAAVLIFLLKTAGVFA